MFCGNSVMRRIIGCSLVFLGVIFLICFMPFWMWLAFIGVLQIGFGCILLLRGY